MLRTPDGVSTFVDGLDHPEGLAMHPDGRWFAGGEAGQIDEIDADGKARREIANTGGFILGVAVAPDGSFLVACDLPNHCLWRLDLTTHELVVLADASAERGGLAVPNFACFAPDGTIYLSDSGDPYKPTGRVLRITPDGVVEVWHAGPFEFANGLALGPDGKSLFVVSSFLPGVERIAIQPDGKPGDRDVFCRFDDPDAIPDGIAFDADGRLYIGCYRPSAIYRTEPDGSGLRVLVADPMEHALCHPTNVAFGGPGFDRLFFTNLGRWHLGRFELGVRGLPLACHRSP